MYAIIESCGRQYKVAEGDVVFFEKLDAEEGKKVTFDKVVLVSDNGKVQIGNPYVTGAKVEGKVLVNGRGKKITVFKYKPKKNERKTIGHRQDYSKVEITSIKAVAEKKATKATENADDVKEEKAEVKEEKTTKKSATKKETK